MIHDAFQNAAVCYARVSTEEQVRGGVSLEAQQERMRAYCRAAGLEVVQLVLEPGVSGSRALASRPGGQTLLELVKTEKVNAVGALKLDRLFRDASDAPIANWATSFGTAGGNHSPPYLSMQQVPS